MLIPKVTLNGMNLFLFFFFSPTTLSGNCDLWHLLRLKIHKDVQLRYLSLNAATQSKGTAWNSQRPSSTQLPKVFELQIIPSSGLAFCCLLFILLWYFKLSQNLMKRGDLIQSCSAKCKQSDNSPCLSRDGRLNRFAPLSRAQREESRCCRSWGSGITESPMRSIRCIKIPWGLCPVCLNVVMLFCGHEKKKEIFVLVPEMY